MDIVHQINKRPWIDQNKIKIKEFVEKFEEEIGSEHTLKITNDNLLNHFICDFNLNKKFVQKLSNDCSIKKLECLEENEFQFLHKIRDFKLNDYEGINTLNARKINLKQFKTNQLYRVKLLKYQKYRTNYMKFDVNKYKESKDSEDVIKNVEALLTIQIFSPLNKYNVKDFVRNNFKMHEFHVLGSQYLSQLKDAYQCISDVISPVDCSNNPNISKSLNKADNYTSSFFFIANCFYVDTRLESNIDYSEVIRKWASDPNRKIGNLEKKSLEKTKFEDLEIQLGYPYLYLHQGNCEHILVISDLRIHNKKDYKFYSSYPCRVGTVNKFTSKCNICETNSAKWIVFENERLPQSPFYFCEICFHSFNYNEKKEPIGKFKAYSYIDNSTIV